MKPYRIAGAKSYLEPISIIKGWDTLSVYDARGICWLFEEPKHDQTYVIGVDPAFGITGWDRTFAGQDDQSKDNTAIEVFRLGKREIETTAKDGTKSKQTIPCAWQVAEYAGPIDYAAGAQIVNSLGRLFSGRGSMGVAHTIIEVYPGNGWMMEKELISKYGYLNFYQPKYINTLLPQTAKGIGWTANQKSVRDLWIMGVRQITNRSVVIRSPWLLNEMETTDPVKFMQYSSEAASGFHDDRLRAMMLAVWAMFDFSAQVKVQTKTTVERNAKATNWQSSDLSADSLKDAWEKRFQEIMDS